MKKTVYECACGQQRKESNHWFLLFHYEGSITLHKWRNDLVDSPNAEHICGPGCLAKAIDAWANPKDEQPKFVDELHPPTLTEVQNVQWGCTCQVGLRNLLCRQHGIALDCGCVGECGIQHI